jgi:flagellar biosynthetic protein FliQ
MDPAQIGDLLQLAITTVLYITGPMLTVGLLIGVLISVVQAATQVQEVTLVFIPKMLAVGFVMWMLGPWMFENLQILFGQVTLHLANVISGGH